VPRSGNGSETNAGDGTGAAAIVTTPPVQNTQFPVALQRSAAVGKAAV
jgi:hypothetical protein